MEIYKDFSLKSYNTFNFDIKAKYFAILQNIGEFIELKKISVKENLPILPLGKGSNVLFIKDFNGIAFVQMNKKISKFEMQDAVIVRAQAGVVWDNLVLFAAKNNLAGIENLSLIPGTVGACPIQNIGAYGQEVKDTITEVKGFYTDTLEEQTFNNSECNFGYRTSIFKKELKSKFIVTEVLFKLIKNGSPNLAYSILKQKADELEKENLSLADVRDLVISIRESKLPDPSKIGNAGSFFKNPIILSTHYYNLKKDFPNISSFNLHDNTYKISAAWLIEAAGFKGYKKGRVGCYEKQPLILCNYGGASADEVIDLKNEIVEKVKSIFSIELEMEVNLI